MEPPLPVYAALMTNRVQPTLTAKSKGCSDRKSWIKMLLTPLHPTPPNPTSNKQQQKQKATPKTKQQPKTTNNSKTIFWITHKSSCWMQGKDSILLCIGNPKNNTKKIKSGLSYQNVNKQSKNPCDPSSFLEDSAILLLLLINKICCTTKYSPLCA